MEPRRTWCGGRLRREVEVSSGALTGGGERITVGWRFWPGRPRVSAAFAAQHRGAACGVSMRSPSDSRSRLTPFQHRGDGALTSRYRSGWRLGYVRRYVEVSNDGTGLIVRHVWRRYASPDHRRAPRRPIDVSGWKASSSFGTIDTGATIRSTTERRGQVFVVEPVSAWPPCIRRRTSGLPVTPVVRVACRCVHIRSMTGGEMRVDRIGRQIVYTSGETQHWWAVQLACGSGRLRFSTWRESSAGLSLATD